MRAIHKPDQYSMRAPRLYAFHRLRFLCFSVVLLCAASLSGLPQHISASVVSSPKGDSSLPALKEELWDEQGSQFHPDFKRGSLPVFIAFGGSQVGKSTLLNRLMRLMGLKRPNVNFFESGIYIETTITKKVKCIQLGVPRIIEHAETRSFVEAEVGGAQGLVMCDLPGYTDRDVDNSDVIEKSLDLIMEKLGRIDKILYAVHFNSLDGAKANGQMGQVRFMLRKFGISEETHNPSNVEIVITHADDDEKSDEHGHDEKWWEAMRNIGNHYKDKLYEALDKKFSIPAIGSGYHNFKPLQKRFMEMFNECYYDEKHQPIYGPLKRWTEIVDRSMRLYESEKEQYSELVSQEDVILAKKHSIGCSASAWKLVLQAFENAAAVEDITNEKCPPHSASQHSPSVGAVLARHVRHIFHNSEESTPIFGSEEFKTAEQALVVYSFATS